MRLGVFSLGALPLDLQSGLGFGPQQVHWFRLLDVAVGPPKNDALLAEAMTPRFTFGPRCPEARERFSTRRTFGWRRSVRGGRPSTR